MRFRSLAALQLAAVFLPIATRSAERRSAEPVPATDLRISVYATAGDLLRYLARPEDRPPVLERLRSLQVSRVFLEGRRGDEYVPPAQLVEIRDALAQHSIRTSGGIATVPGNSFGARQQGPLGWLNWESPSTRSGVAGFFRENAPVFDELIVDDFFCTGDQSPDSDRARGARSWGEYRRDLLVSLIGPVIVDPARAARPDARLFLKFPQWYDRFHLFGYDPARMPAPFDRVWVGTEVRNPATRRMGFVQPTEGYVNFSWLRSVIGDRVIGAWFDHIECTPRNFVDQAFLSVLAGARELTLFRLGDLMENHPGDAQLAAVLPQLQQLAGRVQARETQRRGIPFYKPPGSDAADNLYVMDYLTMMGWPILPVGSFPQHAPVLCLGAQAAADPEIRSRLHTALDRGALVVVTPAFLRALGPEAAAEAGLALAPAVEPSTATRFTHRGHALEVAPELTLDASVRLLDARPVLHAATPGGSSVPLLTTRRHSRGTLALLNIRTFSESDFREAGEWLLAPKALGWSQLPAPAADRLRRGPLAPLRVRFDAPAGVALHLFDDAVCIYNFRPDPTLVRLNGDRWTLAAHECRWIDRPRR